jgi:hypothetical protein
VKPEYFGLDSTGTGRGIGSILRREWSDSIKLIDSTTRASDRPISDTDTRTSRDGYDRKASELQFSVRHLLTSGQIRGFSTKAVAEFASRDYIEVHGKVKVATKADVKARLGKSPDFADAVALVVDIARDNGLDVVTDTTPEYDSHRNEEKIEANQMMYEEEYSYQDDGIHELESIT